MPPVNRGSAVIGVISDTHGLLRPEAVRALRGVDMIIHAGDVGAPEVLAELRKIAPVRAVRGNNDRDRWARALPEQRVISVEGARILVIHDVNELDTDLASERIDAVISGHSHQPRLVRRGGVLFLNPGSAGPRRFRLPIALAHVHVKVGVLRARIIALDAAVERSLGR